MTINNLKLLKLYNNRYKPISGYFLDLGFNTFYKALNYVHKLPYGRSFDRTNYLSVLSENVVHVAQNMLLFIALVLNITLI